VGLLAGSICALAVSLKYRLGFDDSLDVVGVHFVGGWIGSLSIGLFASTAANAGIVDSLGANEGLFTGGGITQLGRQALCSGIVTVFSFSVAYVLGFVINKTIGFRATPEAELEGIDIAEHAESGYDLSPSGGSGGGSAFAMAGIGAPNAGAPNAGAPNAPNAASARPVPDEALSEKVAG
jgi:Amt family ammonium transporter